MFHTLNSPADLDDAIQASHDQPIVIFKHSNNCPFSARAQEQVVNAKHDLEIYGLVVQYKKDVSDAVAEKLNVEHASPQAIIVHQGAAVAHYWRSEIKEDRLKEEVNRLAGQS
ncbi:bacillithiol system protein YtxJ [Neolewinella xylanilytica]|uniref:Bacillithiol system protein YtxJ n=1 Tax=Neolewinella xylanilytica TaxID=1514080 RepID=A0A2S6I318_9BACT|nr:bacillithiol system redox-active protein YtxJ [Neolewinella xylanilytica]PPK85578.1 bacillithiol system protein YtxJ [Neolewinella xylanilytica]